MQVGLSFTFLICIWCMGTTPWSSCPKLMSLVNISLKFQTLISEISWYIFFLLKKCEKLLQCKSFSHFFQQKISVYLVIQS